MGKRSFLFKFVLFIGFLQIHFICCIFKCFILQPENLQSPVSSVKLSAQHQGKAEPETRQGGTSRNIFFESSTGAGGNTDSLLTCMWFLASCSILCHWSCMFLLLLQRMFYKESHEKGTKKKKTPVPCCGWDVTHTKALEQSCVKLIGFTSQGLLTRFAPAFDPPQPDPSECCCGIQGWAHSLSQGQI